MSFFHCPCCPSSRDAGARNYKEISDVIADMPQSLLQKLGAKWNWFGFRYQYPGEKAILEVLKKIDAEMLDNITCAWMFSQAAP